MVIFIDLDGPILDVSEKYYRVYSDILTRHGFSVLPKVDYWEAKRHKTPDNIILEKTDASALIDTFREERNEIIEADQYLRYDVVQENAISVLNFLMKKAPLVLVTLRSSPNQLHKELIYFDLIKYFHAVLTSAEKIKPRWKIKYGLINNFLNSGKTTDSTINIMIGDTETDVLAGKSLGYKTIAVLNGIRSYDLLIETQPSFAVNSINDILSLDII
jgi:phosphoglycolate phosphatase